MTFTPESTPVDPTELLAHMSPHALLAHIRAAVGQLATHGVTITADAQRGIDEVEECVVEFDHRKKFLSPTRPCLVESTSAHEVATREFLGAPRRGKEGLL
jgi:hypothetical protein